MQKKLPIQMILLKSIQVVDLKCHWALLGKEYLVIRSTQRGKSYLIEITE